MCRLCFMFHLDTRHPTVPHLPPQPRIILPDRHERNLIDPLPWPSSFRPPLVCTKRLSAIRAFNPSAYARGREALQQRCGPEAQPRRRRCAWIRGKRNSCTVSCVLNGGSEATTGRLIFRYTRALKALPQRLCLISILLSDTHPSNHEFV